MVVASGCMGAQDAQTLRRLAIHFLAGESRCALCLRIFAAAKNMTGPMARQET